MTVTREQGYRNSQGIEEQGIAMLRDSFLPSAGLRGATGIPGKDNYRLGDLASPSGQVRLEEKTQRGLRRYQHTYVEVLELPAELKEHHRGGMDLVNELLGLPQGTVERASYADWRTGSPVEVAEGIGPRTHASCSLTAIAGSDVTAFVDLTGFVTLYRGTDLLALVAQEVLAGGTMRGRGRSNEVTWGVFVPWGCCWAEWEGAWYAEDADCAPGLELLEQMRARWH